jgi:hypothetical protein
VPPNDVHLGSPGGGQWDRRNDAISFNGVVHGETQDGALTTFVVTPEDAMILGQDLVRLAKEAHEARTRDDAADVDNLAARVEKNRPKS